MEWFKLLRSGSRGARGLPNSWPHRNLYPSVGPAALKSGAAFARIIVGRYVQHVLAGCAEGNRGGRLAAERGGEAGALGALHLRPIRGKHDIPLAAILDPP